MTKMRRDLRGNGELVKNTSLCFKVLGCRESSVARLRIVGFYKIRVTLQNLQKIQRIVYIYCKSGTVDPAQMTEYMQKLWHSMFVPLARQQLPSSGHCCPEHDMPFTFLHCVKIRKFTLCWLKINQKKVVSGCLSIFPTTDVLEGGWHVFRES